mmetsp:Transcript_33234/g.79392  ORF Transcript_33234/g.79392 Transcript_33234/m.79392 type:complete len:200 (-) Transcript_33234:945-1544(-)
MSLFTFALVVRIALGWFVCTPVHSIRLVSIDVVVKLRFSVTTLIVNNHAVLTVWFLITVRIALAGVRVRKGITAIRIVPIARVSAPLSITISGLAAFLLRTIAVTVSAVTVPAAAASAVSVSAVTASAIATRVAMPFPVTWCTASLLVHDFLFAPAADTASLDLLLLSSLRVHFLRVIFSLIWLALRLFLLLLSTIIIL